MAAAACRCLCNTDWYQEEGPDIEFDGLGGAMAPIQPARFSDLLAYSTDMGQPLRGQSLRSGDVWFLRSEATAEKVTVSLFVNGISITHRGKEVRACFSPFTLVRNCKFQDSTACNQLTSLKIFKIFFFVKNLCYFFGVPAEDETEAEKERQCWVSDIANAVHLVTQSLFPPFSISCEPICAAAVTARRLMAGYVLYHSGDDAAPSARKTGKPGAAPAAAVVTKDVGEDIVKLIFSEGSGLDKMTEAHKGKEKVQKLLKAPRLAFYENEQCQRLAMEIWISVASNCFEKVGVACTCFCINGHDFSARTIAERKLWLRAISNLKVKLQNAAPAPSREDLAHYREAIEVSLISGKTVSLETHGEESVESLRVRAQKALGAGKGRLMDSAGSVLDGGAPLKAAWLQYEAPLTLQVRRVDITGGRLAFAAILGDGSVVTWGSSHKGGCSSAAEDQLKNAQQIQATWQSLAAIQGDGSWGDAGARGDSMDVRDQLKNVQQIQSTWYAFAAILSDGSVVTWGAADYGGDSSSVQDRLRNVQQIQATSVAFAAILSDGSVVTWGDPHCGGDSSAVQDQLKNVQHIQANPEVFAAILGDGSVVTWGYASDGGDSTAVGHQLKNVQQIQSTWSAFAAIRNDGSVVSWGDAYDGGDSSSVQDRLRNVQQVQATQSAFAAILSDGSVVSWGFAGAGGDSSAVRDQLKNVHRIQATDEAFAAILGDGSVVTWGYASDGGDSTAVGHQLKNVQHIQATEHAFAAIRNDGSVVSWGEPRAGGDSSAVRDQINNVQEIQATSAAFAAILVDGSVVTWGSPSFGGDCSAVRDELKNVQQIQSTWYAFAAILSDGSVVAWGDAHDGSDSSSVRDRLRNECKKSHK
ncbi:putative E3 ubiquitin-protein ligase HERC1 [Symbiodinium microadriaticum]|uniref:Putative E3 ubiquitin-protein ligase HERC1 n=1 Tax=Symbiodinium microadriaticum TaxID=2951 RepID=A0A1Q9CJW5_SYMMI|nr:putative E3 ubiquitin-protein ligase HERC1 [Symbiodinium microadriaticum]